MKVAGSNQLSATFLYVREMRLELTQVLPH